MNKSYLLLSSLVCFWFLLVLLVFHLWQARVPSLWCLASSQEKFHRSCRVVQGDWIWFVLLTRNRRWPVFSLHIQTRREASSFGIHSRLWWLPSQDGQCVVNKNNQTNNNSCHSIWRKLPLRDIVDTSWINETKETNEKWEKKEQTVKLTKNKYTIHKTKEIKHREID